MPVTLRAQELADEQRPNAKHTTTPGIPDSDGRYQSVMGHPESPMRRLRFCVVFQKHTTTVLNGGQVVCKTRARLTLELRLDADLNTLHLLTISILYGPLTMWPK